MIRYSLVCDAAHGFEAWFRDSLAFDEQNHEGHLSCPFCGSSEVSKAMMTPSVRRSAKGAAPPGPAPAPSAADTVGARLPVMSEPPQILDERGRQMRGLLRDLHAKVKANADNVGPAFPEEARRIHEGQNPPRAIYGTATREEVQSLVEDGVGIMPLPPLPDEHH